MAVLSLITKRQSIHHDYDDDDDFDCDFYEICAWSWGRWLLLVLMILGFVALAFGLLCINSRRRRRQGIQPLYGTGWMAQPPSYGNPSQPRAFTYAPLPPMYSQNGAIPPQQTGNTFNSNEGYYGHHEQPAQKSGIELQPPANVHTRGGEDVYQPLTGPPSGKTAEDDDAR